MKRITLAANQTIGDIINAVEAMHENQRRAYREMYGAQAPAGRNVSKRLYDIAMGAIRYSEEPERSQTVKTLHAIMRDRVGDCKHYASIICGIANAWGFPACYRYADYGKGIQHVYAVVLTPYGWEVIDPVPRMGVGYEEPFKSMKNIYVRPN